MMRIMSFRSLNASVRRRLYSTTEGTMKSGKTTIDQKDVDHHSKLSEGWWNVDGRMKGLHSFNPLRIQLVKDGLLSNTNIRGQNPSFPLEKFKILDVGCGGGILAEPLTRAGAEVTGIDASKDLIEVATAHAALDSNITERLSYINTSIEEHSESNADKYDAVVASEIVEHVTDPELFLKSCAAVTKPGGSVFVTTLNRTIYSYLGAIIVCEYIARRIPIGTHDWRQFITPNETKKMLESYGCETKLIRGFSFNPFRNVWSSRSSTLCFYGLHAIKK